MNSIHQTGTHFLDALVHLIEVCSPGQITECLTGVVGKSQPMV